MNIRNLKLRFNTVNPNAARITENDKKTFIASIRDVIALDAAVVTSAGNINVSTCLLRQAALIDN